MKPREPFQSIGNYLHETVIVLIQLPPFDPAWIWARRSNQ